MIVDDIFTSSGNLIERQTRLQTSDDDRWQSYIMSPSAAYGDSYNEQMTQQDLKKYQTYSTRDVCHGQE